MKKFTALLLSALMVLNLAACQSEESAQSTEPAASETTSTEKSTEVSTEPVTIKFANYALLEQGYTEFWEGVKTGFEAENPNIKIEWVTAPYGEITNTVINMAGAGDKVDIIFGEDSWTPTYVDSGLAAPIDTILSEEFLSDFYPNALEANNVDGEYYAVPLYSSPYVLYYNKDIFVQAGLDPEKPPTTYDEMLVMAEEISKLQTADGNKIYPFGQTTASVPISGSSITAMIYNFGGTLLTPEGQLNADTEAFKQTFEMLATLDEKGYCPQNAKLKDLRNLFAIGQLAMYYDQSWGFNGVQSINPEAKNFTASAAPLAGGSGTGESILQEHVFILVDNGDAQTEAVRKLVEYIITPEVLGDYMSTITPAYPVKKSMSNMDSINNNPVLMGAAGSIEKAMPAPTIPAMADLNLELATLAQAVTVSDTPVDEAIASFKSAAESIIN